uniref:Beta-crystallin A2 n=1 Tax=Anas platyrhynchos platyrhynchos TaxID=8840 RepID=A0A493T6U2_ANAPP
MTSEAMDTLGQHKITVWEEESFQGKRCEFLMECPSIMERGFRKIRSIKVESGPWVGFEYPEYQGQQFILEKGDYPRWEAWSGNSGYRTEHLLSFRPVKCAVSGGGLGWGQRGQGVGVGRTGGRGDVGWRAGCAHWLSASILRRASGPKRSPKPSQLLLRALGSHLPGWGPHISPPPPQPWLFGGSREELRRCSGCILLPPGVPEQAQPLSLH